MDTLSTATVATGLGAVVGIGLEVLCATAQQRRRSQSKSQTTQPAERPKPQKLVLKYWDGRGLAEVPRQLLAIAGVPYDDVRIHDTGNSDARYDTGQHPSTTTRRPTVDVMEMVNDKDLDINLGRVPVLVVDGTPIGQSSAISRFIAHTNGLMGSTPVEAAQIDSFCEALGELKAAFIKAADKDAFFDAPNDGTDTSGMAVRPGKDGVRAMKWYCGRLEHIVGGNGCSVGSKISLAVRHTVAHTYSLQTKRPVQACVDCAGRI